MLMDTFMKKKLSNMSNVLFIAYIYPNEHMDAAHCGRWNNDKTLKLHCMT